MKRLLLSAIMLVFSIGIFSQNYNYTIDSLIRLVDRDSLVSFVRILSGEDSVMVNGNKVLIKQRVYNNNDMAAAYIKQTLENYGLEPVEQDFGVNGTNIYAIRQGTVFPDEYYIICAHYDAVTFYAADDNASGTATVLEAARLLADVDFTHSLVFALWDEEEIGLYGSNYYASEASLDGMDIKGVVNIDMIGWDGNDDGLVEVHANNMIETLQLAQMMESVNTDYALGLNVVVENPGAQASDHASFWSYGFGAVLLIEAYYNNDFNPYYHTPADRIAEFNLPYFHSSAMLAIGSLISIAEPDQFVGTQDVADAGEAIGMLFYPNPARYQATLKYNLTQQSSVQIMLVNQLGQKISLAEKHPQPAGEHQFDVNTSGLRQGIYTLLLNTGNEQLSQRIVVIN